MLSVTAQGSPRAGFPRLSILAFALLAAMPLARAGEPGNDELLARIAALEQRLGIAAGETGEGASLDQRLRIIERRLELQDEAATARAAKEPAVSLDAGKGLSVKAPGGLEVKLRGLVQADFRHFDDDLANDGFLFRRVRPTLEGSWGPLLGFRITPEFAGDSATLVDAYVDLKFDPRATMRIGKVKGPVGLERLQGGAAVAFVERGLPTELAPNRDLGVQLQGDVLDKTLHYDVGVYNGAVDGRDAATTNPDDELEYAGRLFWEPFKNAAGAHGTLGLGVAASIGDKYGAGNDFLPRYRTPGQQTFFSYGSNVAAAGEHRRHAAHGYYYRGPLGLLGEYIVSSQAVGVVGGTGAGTHASLDNKAWQLSAGWVLTGEDAGFRGVAAPARPFAVGGDGWGALELVARYGELDIDDDAFLLFANPATAASRIDSWGFGLNWYLNRNLKLAANYTEARFDGGAVDGDRTAEKALFTRAQLSF